MIGGKYHDTRRRHYRGALRAAGAGNREVGETMRSPLESLLDQQMRLCRLPAFVTEYRFDNRPKPRNWRFDFAWPDRRVAVEVEGGVWSQGRHTRAQGFISDTEKYNAAVMQGWRVLRYTRDAIESGRAITEIEQILQREPATAAR